jgi:thioredoxin 1
MKLKAISAKAFAGEVIRADRPVLVHFSAAWCKVSLDIAPIVEKLAQDMAAEVKVVRVDSTNKALCARLGVTRFPTQQLFVDGMKVDEILGATSESSLRGTIKDAVAARQKTLTVGAGAGKPAEVVDANFGRRVLQSETPVMAVFWARSCAASLQVLQHINEATAAAARQKISKVQVVPIEAKLAPATCARLQVTRLPTTFVFEHGSVVDTLGGVLSPASITKVLKAHA